MGCLRVSCMLGLSCLRVSYGIAVTYWRASMDVRIKEGFENFPQWEYIVLFMLLVACEFA